MESAKRFLKALTTLKKAIRLHNRPAALSALETASLAFRSLREQGAPVEESAIGRIIQMLGGVQQGIRRGEGEEARMLVDMIRRTFKKSVPREVWTVPRSPAQQRASQAFGEISHMLKEEGVSRWQRRKILAKAMRGHKFTDNDTTEDKEEKD